MDAIDFGLVLNLHQPPGNFDELLERSEWEAKGQDARDADALYRLVEHAVVPAFYDRDADGIPRARLALIRASMRTLAPAFSARRMLGEHVRPHTRPYGRFTLTVTLTTLSSRGVTLARCRRLAAPGGGTRRHHGHAWPAGRASCRHFHRQRGPRVHVRARGGGRLRRLSRTLWHLVRTTTAE